jgi:YbgC/YbaW family acyl-CoA thioester hydrolase
VLRERVDRVVSHRERFRVGWVDTDASGRIHHTAVFRWVEATEIALFRRLDLLGDGVGRWPRRHVEASYIQALGFEDEIEVGIRVASVGTTSITFDWEISRDGEIAVSGRHTAVQVDESGRPLALDAGVRNSLLGIRELRRLDVPSA